MKLNVLVFLSLILLAVNNFVSKNSYHVHQVHVQFRIKPNEAITKLQITEDYPNLRRQTSVTTF